MEYDFIKQKAEIINEQVKNAKIKYFKKREGILEMYPDEFFESMFYSYKADLFNDAKRELILLSEKNTLELTEIIDRFHSLVFCSENS